MGPLLASLFWGSVGVGFVVYGKKQAALSPLFGGVALVLLSYFVTSPLILSLVSALLIAGIWKFRHLGN
jgi:hypothetical protein